MLPVTRSVCSLHLHKLST
uniref:Uncharacterized protein n=1 Tax=Rhizophora mucronata TaxID=61149 RepID=A0A2P2NW45_RHIMU